MSRGHAFRVGLELAVLLFAFLWALGTVIG